MQFNVYSDAIALGKHELLILPINAKPSAAVEKFLNALPDSHKKRQANILSQGFNNHELLLMPEAAKSVKASQWLLLINAQTNNADDVLDNNQYQQILQSIANGINKTQAKSTLVVLEDIKLNIDGVSQAKSMHALYQQAVTVIDQKFYNFDQCKTGTPKPAKSFPLKSTKIQFYSKTKTTQSVVREAIKTSIALSEGMALCKDLANLPGNICTPSYLAKIAKALAKESTIKTQVFDEKQMEKLGMRTLLSVSKGSDEPAKFIVMEYQGAKKTDAPVVLIGKGLTFDAGGISIKPAAAMDEMKYDMCGGATVFGVMKALSVLKPKMNVIGVVPSSENLINGKANKPGDIIKTMDGKTVEILNTDAEGRLILADALTYSKKFKAKATIDIATLTGACIIALGHHMSGLFSNDDKLANELLSAGKESGDLAWQLPLHPLYTKQLQSNFADLGNIGGRSAGAITAAAFLQEFVEPGTAWAHLDIAGTAWVSGANKGATARPVSLLLNYLLNQN